MILLMFVSKIHVTRFMCVKVDLSNETAYIQFVVIHLQ